MRRSALLAVIVVMLLAAACGAREAGPAGDETDASPEVVASPTAADVPPTVEPRATDPGWQDGFVLTMNGSYPMSVPPAGLARGVDLLVIGRVIEELPARWTTPDGLRPADLSADVPDQFTIVTPYVLELDVPEYLRSITGPLIPLNDGGAAAYAATTESVTVVVEGGTVGIDSVVISPTYLLSVGDRVVLALVATRSDRAGVALEPLVPTAEGPVWWGFNRIFLNDDGSAEFYDETLSAPEAVSEILDAVEQMTAATPVP